MFRWTLALLLGLSAIPLAMALPHAWGFAHGAPFASTFALGAAGGAALTVLILRKAPMLAVLEHEMTHLLVALLHLRLPESLQAGKDGGEVVYSGDSAFLIRLAPYVLPTFTLLLLGLSPFVAPEHQGALRTVVGVTWGYHVTTALYETRPRQPDLQAGGRVPALMAVAGLSLLLYTGSALWAVRDFGLCRDWVHEAGRVAVRLASLARG